MAEGIRKSFYFPTDDIQVLREMEKAAEKLDRSESWIVKQALKEYLKNKEVN